ERLQPLVEEETGVAEVAERRGRDATGSDAAAPAGTGEQLAIAAHGRGPADRERQRRRPGLQPDLGPQVQVAEAGRGGGRARVRGEAAVHARDVEPHRGPLLPAELAVRAQLALVQLAEKREPIAVVRVKSVGGERAAGELRVELAGL